jgi:predicted alpha/beta hydrolase
VAIIAPIVTHWSRILHFDLFTGVASGDVSSACLVGGGACASTSDLAVEPSSHEPASRREFEWVTLSADGYPITAIRYPSRRPVRAHLIVAGAVGVAQRFYRPFAEFAASAGYSTMTFDYRGIGLSAPTSLENFQMDYFDWGRLDLAAAVDAMSAPDVPLYIIGHAFGGHAFGMLPNHERVAAFYTFGTGAGWDGWMSPLARMKAVALRRLVGPALARKGYLPASLLGMGEDLPLEFYERWKRWCRFPNYFFGDASVQHVTQNFDRIRAAVMAVNSIDDRWAPPRSRDAFMAGYRNAALHTLDLDPSLVGLRSIGHMGYFKPRAMPLWNSALDWLATHRNRWRASIIPGSSVEHAAR